MKVSKTFYIVDDDKSVRKILDHIITSHNLGEVIGEAGDGVAARREVAAMKPGIVLIDLLLPGVDGIALVSGLKETHPDICFVMVSQVTDKDMVSKAYMAGIDFFIAKPINVVEVVSVLRKVQDKMDMQSVLRSLRDVIGGIDGVRGSGIADKSPEEELKRRLNSALSRLGILGESGSNDIAEMCRILLQSKQKGTDVTVKLNDLYGALTAKYAENGINTNTATIEQRIRRCINKALNNLANLGMEDYGNEFFISFGSAFFEFAEIRRQMNYIRGSSATPGKISVKKFLEGMCAVIEHD